MKPQKWFAILNNKQLASSKDQGGPMLFSNEDAAAAEIRFNNKLLSDSKIVRVKLTHEKIR